LQYALSVQGSTSIYSSLDKKKRKIGFKREKEFCQMHEISFEFIINKLTIIDELYWIIYNSMINSSCMCRKRRYKQ